MGHGGNVINELSADHREVEELFAQIAARPAEDAERRTLADRLTMELVRHAVAEEEYLYPAVRRYVDDGDDIADKELTDHGEIERLLKDLEGRGPGEPQFDTLVTRLRSVVTEHVRDEEERLFRLLADSCPAELLDTLGEKVRKAKKTAPTRPHPAAPDTPGLLKLLAPGAGMVDRVRDKLTGRGKQP
ncbi:hemerythrin domain-containing protein [Streptomyces sp. URMC 127]|uniref:hemerythrin domain-containing protein n=1 Tax=Streptomyces sp. URMC 127 TaxID=3423402 RepID=UPI003F1CDBEB